MVFRIKDVHLAHIKSHFHILAQFIARARIDARHQIVVAAHQVDVNLVAHQLQQVHLAFHLGGLDAGGGIFGVINIFRPNAKDYLLAVVRFVGFDLVLGNFQFECIRGDK